MREIVLTQGKVALADDEDFEYLNQFKWRAQKGAKTFYALRSSPWINGKRPIIMMHYEVLGKPSKGFETDHKNGQGLDNQRHNLRHVTCRQNHQNRKNVKSSSRYPGVSWDKSRQKWEAAITIYGTKKHLGRFMDEKEAFNTYERAVNSIGETVINN